jgi:dTDP-4-dehydrorhamnose reductase
MRPRLVILGAHGQVGWRLQRALNPLGEVIALPREVLNLSDPDRVRGTIRDLRPDVVVNAAAYTAVDKAESEAELARIINAAAPQAMADELMRAGGLLIHYSSDYVFDGSKGSPYVETDATAPVNIYGKTKLEGEQMVSASGCAHLILRTTWIYDTRGKNFLRTILRLGRDQEELRIVGDQVGAPTWAYSLADATAVIVASALSQRTTNVWPHSGIYHLTAAGQTPWAGFAEAIVEEHRRALSAAEAESDPGTQQFANGDDQDAELRRPLRAVRVVAIRTEDYPTPARRPRYSVLSNAKIQAAFGVTMTDWRAQLRLAMQDAVRR